MVSLCLLSDIMLNEIKRFLENGISGEKWPPNSKTFKQ